MYDDRTTLVTRLTAIRTALDKAREAISYNSGNLSVSRDYTNLLKEEKEILSQIAAVDAGGGGGIGGGMANKVSFERPE
ncbi:MAG: hypothetical protein NTX36_10205 [Proteobacteria bacterium]|nr:hypothetical protein [Pseudomonadota bacterium]